jgi:pyruvate,water dikinase
MKDSERSNFLEWKDAYTAGTEVAGGKGWNLARLDRYGFSLPTGGILTAQAYRDFVLHNRMVEKLQIAAEEMDRLDPAGGRQVELFDEIKHLFLSGQVPPPLAKEIEDRLSQWGLADAPLAVRSSAAVEDSPSASFAGIHDSFLNVHGREDLLSAIKGCWASVWNPRAAAYRRRMGFSGAPSPPAVVIMEMVDPAASGVAFSCHPGNGREDQVFISANFGLGESVVGGSVDPDEYTVQVGFHSLHHSLVSRKVGRKEKKTVPEHGGGTRLEDSPQEGARQALSDKDILRLARLVRRVYCALGNFERHQDVEWVFDGNDRAPLHISGPYGSADHLVQRQFPRHASHGHPPPELEQHGRCLRYRFKVGHERYRLSAPSRHFPQAALPGPGLLQRFCHPVGEP